MNFPRWVYRGNEDWRYNPIKHNRMLVKNITEYCEAIEICGWRESPVPTQDYEEKTVIENQEESDNDEDTPLFPKRGRGRPRKVL